MLLLSNAKINLELNITGKIGKFHTLESVIVPINIYDKIYISESENDDVIGMDIPKENNLMYKALKLLKKEYNIQKCVKIEIEKNIPMQAGLGGGSSNAAFVLKGLNELWNLNVSNEKLENLALLLGSDVPFFIRNVPAIVSGIGEKIETIENFPNFIGVLVFNNNFYSTKEVFEKIDKFPFSKSKIELLRKGKLDYKNDLDKEKPEIARITAELLNHGAYAASMSGSGGSLFGLFYEKSKAMEYMDIVKNKYAYVKLIELA